jgi:hypothetical protein
LYALWWCSEESEGPDAELELIQTHLNDDGDHKANGDGYYENMEDLVEERQNEESTEQADSMAKVSRALCISVCILSVALAIISSLFTLSPFATACQQGSDTFKTRQTWLSIASDLHSGEMVRCGDIWPQLCTSSCDWDQERLQCDSIGRPVNLTLKGTAHPQGTAHLQLWGAIPTMLSEFKSTLQAVDLSHNKLSSTIPSSLSLLSRLTTLDLSHNILQGAIPSSLGFLTALKVLRLNDNILVEDTIPAGVPSAGFPQSGDCEMSGQCSACSFKECCGIQGQQYDWTGQYGQYRTQDGMTGRAMANDPYCTEYRTQYGQYRLVGTRRDSPVCRICGFLATGQCNKHANACADVPWAEKRCGANCTSIPQ